jgi:hypothetical protein
MEVDIIDEIFNLGIYGFSGLAINKDYTGKAFQLMDKMWRVVKEKELKHKGINIWVYDLNDQVFAGVELYDTTIQDTGMEKKTIHITKYAYYKHVGPYHLLKQVGQKMRDELRNKGFETAYPYVEIYGHWTKDETALETELLMSLL